MMTVGNATERERKGTVAGAVSLSGGLILALALLYASTGTGWAYDWTAFISYAAGESSHQRAFSAALLVCGILVAIFGVELIWVKRVQISSVAGILFFAVGLVATNIGAFGVDSSIHTSLIYFMVFALFLGTLLMIVNDWMDGNMFAGGICLVLMAALSGSMMAHEASAHWYLASYGLSLWMVIQGVKYLLD